MPKKKTVPEINGETLVAGPAEETFVSAEELEPIDDNFNVEKNESMVGAINAILTNVQTLIHYLEFAQTKGIFSFGDCADIYNSINKINSVTDGLEG